MLPNLVSTIMAVTFVAHTKQLQYSFSNIKSIPLVFLTFSKDAKINYFNNHFFVAIGGVQLLTSSPPVIRSVLLISIFAT